jgi:REP element-mobilizing transposase RayT
MPNQFWRYQAHRNARLDRRVYAVAGQACFITTRAHRGSAPFREPRLARIVCDCIREQQVKSTCLVHAYCLMPDHMHVLVSPRELGASSLEYIQRLKGWTSFLLHRSGWTGPLWQPDFYDHVVRTDEELGMIAAYILANPVRAGLVTSPDEYSWSGLGTPDSLPST